MTGGARQIRDLALIGDRRTAAVVSTLGEILWYAPQRFDRPSLLGALLDPERGGAWTIAAPDLRCERRAYREDSGVLDTHLRAPGGVVRVTDFMPMGRGTPRGICRLISASGDPVVSTLTPAPQYAGRAPSMARDGEAVCVDGTHWIHASTALELSGGSVSVHVPAHEDGWMILLDGQCGAPTTGDVHRWCDATLGAWEEIASHVTYRGPYEREVAASLRALRLLTHEPTGGIVAAATTSLPEVLGGERNYDYRYVWMRDAGMIVSALVRAGSDGADERRFLGFICGARGAGESAPLLPPFLTLDLQPAPRETYLSLAGFADSRPVRVGNNATGQFQLDGFGNVLLAAKLIYGRHDTRDHWETVAAVADFVAAHWREADNGLWEEHQPRQYTSSKVIASCGLRYIAACSHDAAQVKRWIAASQDIDRYVARHCLTSDGAYAAFVGSEAVDVSAVLFPIWGYTAADAPEMLATVAALERTSMEQDLYWRHLEEEGTRREGAFLAGTIWVAQYWIMRGDLHRARATLDAALAYANDVGLFAEEGDPRTRRMLGNMPQTFVHAAFIGAVVDYREATAP